MCLELTLENSCNNEYNAMAALKVYCYYNYSPIQLWHENALLHALLIVVT